MAREDGYSPAQLFFGRRQRQRLPCTPSHCLLETPNIHARDSLARPQAAPRNERTKTYRQLSIGEKAWLQNQITGKWDTQVEIESVREGGQSYTVRTSGGKIHTRGTRLLRPLKGEKSGNLDIQSNPAASATSPASTPPPAIIKSASLPVRVQPPRLVKKPVMSGRRNLDGLNLPQPSDNFTVLEQCRRIFTSEHVQAGHSSWNPSQQQRHGQQNGQ